jgi:hypothetical protein
VFSAEPRAAMRIRIHDFGATPGVVGMRLAEAFEALAPQTARSRHEPRRTAIAQSFVELGARERARAARRRHASANWPVRSTG